MLADSSAIGRAKSETPHHLSASTFRSKVCDRSLPSGPRYRELRPGSWCTSRSSEVLPSATWQRCRTHFMLGVLLRSTGAARQVATVPHRNQPWLYFMLAPASAGCPRYELPGWSRERRVPALA